MSDLNPKIDPIGYRCDGCGRLCRDPFADLSSIKASGKLSCCPERKMVGLSDRIEELEAKLDLSEGALDVASKSWGECQRILEQTEAKLAKCEALMHAGLAEYKRRLVMALEAMKFWSQAQEPEIDAAIDLMQTTLAELEGELDD